MKKGDIVRLQNGSKIPNGMSFVVIKGGRNRIFCHGIENGIESEDTTYIFTVKNVVKVVKKTARVSNLTFATMDQTINPAQLRFRISQMWMDVYFGFAGYLPGQFVLKLITSNKESMYLYMDDITVIHPGDKVRGFVLMNNLRKA